MKKRAMIIATLLVAICNIVFAEDKVTINDFNISAGETKDVHITLENDDAYVAFQFDLYLPEGITIEDCSDNPDRVPKSTTITVSQQDDGSYRFLAAAMQAEPLIGNNGVLLTLTVKASENLAYGEKIGYFRKVKLSKSDATGPTYAEMSFPITVIEPSVVTVTSVSRKYGEANPTFEYVVEGGALDGTPEITCEATETSPIGTYPVTITKGSVTNYNVTYVAGTLTITKAPLNIAAETYTKKQGEAMPEFTLTYTGFKNNETKDVLTKQAVVTCEATTASAPGDYSVTVSGAEAQNYDISYTNGKLIVTEADLVTITAQSYTREYGEANPVFEYTTEGAALEGIPEISCEATATSPVGTYDIIVKQGTIANYNVAYVAGTLTITKSPLNIAAGTYTKKQGEAMPDFSLTYTGFKNDETKDVLTQLPTVSCNANEASAPGEYPVTVSGAEAQNYDISYTNGKLIVVDADAVIVKANSYTREYGEVNPTFEYTVEGAALDGVPEITCEATATSPAGTYDIVVKQGTITNYNVTYVAGTLTITKAPLNIAAGTYTKKQGEAMPEFTLTYTGFKNNETKDVLTTLPTVSCSATEASVPGEYLVSVSGAEARNYEISYTNGKLIVTEADLVTITAKSYTREYGDANPTFEYTVEGAALDGVPEITCEATATSPVGTYDIIVKQGTVKNYNVAYVAGTLTVTKAPLNIAAGTYTKKQGEAMPEFTLTYTGFKNNETKDVLTKQAVVTCEATEASAPGEYPVTVSGAEARNYNISYTNGKLIVADADAIIVKVKSFSREYGDANPAFEYTVEGGALEGTPEITCEATATSPVGTYPITITKGSVTNYNVTYVAGTLTITKAPLNIAAGTYAKKQGEAMPEFTLTYSGFKNNETKDVLTSLPTVSCSATEASAPGEYPVIVSGADTQNYNISYTNGKLIVTEADLVTITAKSYTREYGEANPTFEYTIEGATLDGVPEITCEATATSPVGTYDIVVKQGTVTNYNVAYVAGTLTITKAPLTVTVENATREQGQANPEFVINYSGWKNGEDENVLIFKPTATTEATIDSPAGEYSIIVSGGEAQNYEFSYTNGILTITESTGIRNISMNHPADVYDMRGNMIRSKATTLKGLATGLYIVNGRKITIK